MVKILLGLFLIVVSVMLSFIPPFIFGLPVAFLAFGMIMAGLGKTAGQAVRGGLSAASYLKSSKDVSSAERGNDQSNPPSRKELILNKSSDDYRLTLHPNRHGWRQ